MLLNVYGPDSKEGTGEHYAKWNKPGGERQMPYDHTYKWNLMNKTNKWAKWNQRHGNKEQTDSDQREGVGGCQEEEGEGSSQRTYIMDPRTKTTGGGGGLNVGGGVWVGHREKMGTTEIEQ